MYEVNREGLLTDTGSKGKVFFFWMLKRREGEWMKSKKRKEYHWLLTGVMIVVFVNPLLWGPMEQVWAKGGTMDAGRLALQNKTEKKGGELQTGRKAAAGRFWNLGDVVIRNIHGTPYRFRCIDTNYADRMGYRRPGALFLCDSVIPADYGSRFELDISQIPHRYVFYPGPIVNFGETGAYKTSGIRQWLKTAEEDEFADAESINIGVAHFCRGRTAEGAYEQLRPEELSSSYAGSQKMADKLFILSVDEALRYRNQLWRFGSGGIQNPETQISSFCKGYWLRTALGTGRGQEEESEYVYIVDLVQGNIRPERVRPQADSGEDDQELQVTGTIGVRPVFVLPQKSYLDV